MNLVRRTWDPEENYALYSFVRQAQTFPDVLLRKGSDGEVLLGIELKGWYLLAKEAEPSLRFQAASATCAKADLIETSLCGIRTVYWRDFLRMFQENTTDEQARLALGRLRNRIDLMPSPFLPTSLRHQQPLEIL